MKLRMRYEMSTFSSGGLYSNRQELTVAVDDHRHDMADAAQCFLYAADFGRRRSGDDQDLVAGLESGRRGVALRVDGLDNNGAVVALKGEVDPLERGAFALERNERTQHNPHCEDGQ